MAKRSRFNTKLDSEILEQAKAKAKELDINTNDLIEVALYETLKKVKNQKDFYKLKLESVS